MPPWAGTAAAVLGTHVQLTRPQAAPGFTPHPPVPWPTSLLLWFLSQLSINGFMKKCFLSFISFT